jgi:hypothetical protein
MRFAAVFLGFFCALLSRADQLQALLPLPLAARVVAGPRWDGAVVLEPYDATRVRVTVERERPDFSLPWPAGVGASQCPAPDTCQVEMTLPLPPELRGLSHLPPAQRLLRVVAWVSRWVQVRDEDRGPQDALSVLRRRQGRCSGRANLAVAFLRQLGVPARVVHGLWFGPQGISWHRWGEAWIAGFGFLPFDPGVAVGAVSVRYVPMTGAGEGVPLVGIQLLHVEEEAFQNLPKILGLRVFGPWFARPRVTLGEVL